MKKYLNIFLTLILVLFSFYYTDKVSKFIKKHDPIMIKILDNKDKLENNPINAIIINNTMIPGKMGIKVNINKSYKKMKKINKYIESLYIFDYIKPNISIKNQYDKVIINGNNYNHNISILLKINNIDILKKLKDNSFNFILTNDFINNNKLYLSKISNNIVVIEQNNLNNLDIINYCYIENTFNSYCSKYNIYTIKPQFITNNNYYNTSKLIKNGSILAYNIINENNIKELNTIISYIKTLNYKIVSIDELIKE